MSNTIETLRNELFAQIAELRAARGTDQADQAVKMARATSDIAGRIIETAKVEVDYVRAVGRDASSFFAGQDALEHKHVRAISGGRGEEMATLPRADLRETWATAREALDGAPKNTIAQRVTVDGRVRYARVGVA